MPGKEVQGILGYIIIMSYPTKVYFRCILSLIVCLIMQNNPLTVFYFGSKRSAITCWTCDFVGAGPIESPPLVSWLVLNVS